MNQIVNILRKAIWGLAFIVVGVLLLLSNHGIISAQFSFRQDWPVVFVLIGLSQLLDSLG